MTISTQVLGTTLLTLTLLGSAMWANGIPPLAAAPAAPLAACLDTTVTTVAPPRASTPVAPATSCGDPVAPARAVAP